MNTTLQCPNCSSNNVRKNGFGKTGRQAYKCFECKRQFLFDGVIQTNCLNCGKITSNPKFCSQSCSTAHNNKTLKLKHGNNARKICKACGVEETTKSVHGLCRNCYINITKTAFYRNFLTRTIGDVAILESRFRETTEVRRIARELWQRLNYPQHCEICGYDKHYEICHIEAIKNFSLETKLRVVNNPANLVALCPNCHWEFDHHAMDEEDLERLHLIAASRKKAYLAL